jgi:hypothetical protein
MIGGGFSSIDKRGFMFWGIVLIFLLSIIFTVISWVKIKKLSMNSLLFSSLAMILCILPAIITMTLIEYNNEVWQQQKTQMLLK